jgi:hypothetical protein
MLQRPLDLDSACSLALLQEEVALPFGRPEYRKEAYQPWLKSATSSARPMPLPPPPTSSVHKCHTRFWKVNRMRTMYVPGSETHVHSNYIIGHHHTMLEINSGKVLDYIKMSKTSTKSIT